MKKNVRTCAAALLTVLFYPVHGYSADIAGTWKAEFETQIGIQKYAFTFTQSEKEITGTADSDIGGNTQEVKLTEIKLDSSKISFVENLQFQGMELRIRYEGTVSGDEMKLTRQVGEVATEELTAKRERTEK